MKLVGFLPITGSNTEGSQKFEKLRNISESLGISRRVGERFRGFEEYFGGFYKAEGKTLKGRGRGQRKLGGTRREQKKVGRAILGGAVRENSLGLSLMCFNVKNDYQNRHC